MAEVTLNSQESHILGGRHIYSAQVTFPPLVPESDMTGAERDVTGAMTVLEHEDQA